MAAIAAPDTSSPRGSVLGKLRRIRRENGSTNSLPVNAERNDDATQENSLQATPDLLLSDNGRDRARSTDGGRESEERPRRLSSMLSRTKQKLRKNSDTERKLSIGSRNGSTSIAGNHSDVSLFPDESGRSSLLTDDNTSEYNISPSRPILASRDSHAGYLTLSSPEISVQTHPVSAIDKSPSLVSGIPSIIEPTDEHSHPASTSEAPESAEDILTDPLEKPSEDSAAVRLSKSREKDLTGNRVETLHGNSQDERAQKDVLEASTVDGQENALRKGKAQSPDDTSRPKTPKDRSRQLVDTSAPLPSTPPNRAELPSTLVTPPTPTDKVFAFDITDHRRAQSPPAAPKVSSVGRDSSIKHRRGQSAGLPSKLSHSISTPLSPTLEETKTPGGTITHPPSGGFFSSVFSVAQRAADQILPYQKSSQPRGLPSNASGGGEEVIPGVESRTKTDGTDTGPPPAIATLGRGNLSLSHLGISEQSDISPMNSTTSLQQQVEQAQNVEIGRKAEQEAAARAVSSAYEKPYVGGANESAARPASLASNERLVTGDQTPPKPVADGDSSGLRRTGSARSKLSQADRRKHRATSSATAATSNSIATALKDSAGGLSNIASSTPGHRLTGFAVASSKRNRDFHNLFRSVPEDDYLIEDYSAALQRDILLHGRLYVSEGHVCFSSNILGWVTTLIISFDEIVSIEKKNTAVIFPNAILISTLHARNTFASFVARDSTYELLIGIWKISHPNLKSSLNGVMLDNAGTGDKTEIADPDDTDAETDDGSEDEVYDEDADDDVGSFTDAGGVSRAVSEAGDPPTNRKTSAAQTFPATQPNLSVPKGLENADTAVTGAAVSSDFPGSTSHGPSECADMAEHYERPLTDTVIPAPLGKVYSMMFGPASGAFMRKWLVDDQKSRDLNYVDDKTGLDNDHKTFSYNYVKPLNAPVGPRQTKCLTTCNLTAFDLDKAVSVDCSTQTPDVPSGNVFTVRTRYCLMWGPGNSTRMIATCTIEWTGKSWLKGAIDKGANDGQLEYVKSIIAALKAAVTTKPPVKGVARKGKRKGKREVFDADEANAKRDAAVAAEQDADSWGVFEPLHQILEPVIALVRPFITSQVVIAVLFVLLVWTWVVPSRSTNELGFLSGGYASPHRIVAYEEIWRREQSALWDWLEDRLGLEDGYMPQRSSSSLSQQEMKKRQKVLNTREMGRKLDVDDHKMSERQMDTAIRTTEERLAALKEAVERRKSGGAKT